MFSTCYMFFFTKSVTLIQSDEYSMINSTEIRSPFVNKELFKILINLPIKFFYKKIKIN